MDEKSKAHMWLFVGVVVLIFLYLWLVKPHPPEYKHAYEIPAPKHYPTFKSK